MGVSEVSLTTLRRQSRQEKYLTENKSTLIKSIRYLRVNVINKKSIACNKIFKNAGPDENQQQNEQRAKVKIINISQTIYEKANENIPTSTGASFLIHTAQWRKQPCAEKDMIQEKLNTCKNLNQY